MFFSKKKKNAEEDSGLGEDVNLEELFGDEEEPLENVTSDDLLYPEKDEPENIQNNLKIAQDIELEKTEEDLDKENNDIEKKKIAEDKTETALLEKSINNDNEKNLINDLIDSDSDVKIDSVATVVEKKQKSTEVNHFEEKVEKRPNFKNRLEQKVKESATINEPRDHSKINSIISSIKKEVREKRKKEMEKDTVEQEKKDKKSMLASLKDKINETKEEFENKIEEEKKKIEQKVINKEKKEIKDSEELNSKIKEDIVAKKDVEVKIEKEKKIPIENKKHVKSIKKEVKENITTIAKQEDEFSEGKLLKFPEGFLWGTSTSAYQVEGGIECDWSKWEISRKRSEFLSKKNLNSSQFICGQACDSRNRYKEDLDLSVELNNNAVRFGLEWARLMPDKNTVNVSEINYYRDKMEEAKKRGLKIAVTLWHWTNPTWISDNGGWSNKETVEHFKDYVDIVIKEFGAYIDYWVTLNEPMIHVFNGYVRGKFPPARKLRFIKANKAFNNLVQAHKNSYEMIHNHFINSQVSITNITNYVEPAYKWCLIDILISKIIMYFANTRFLQKIIKHIDYIGLDYYFHDRVVCYPPFIKNKNEVTTDMGWEIYPEGIYGVLKYLNQFKKPIIIIENGLADKEDKLRADFIKDHLRYIHRAITEGVDVRGYFYWSLIDNFEWADGFAPKFGLYEVNMKTFERKARPSVKVYAEICKNNAVEDFN